MPDYIEKTIAAYNQNTDKYVESTAGMTPPSEFGRFIELIKDGDGPILDAGCAFGRDTAAFKEHGFEVVGIDLSDGLLEQAHRLHPDLSFQKMDVRQLDFPDNYFAGIWCHAVLLHLNDQDIEEALKEFHRVLKPGGGLFVSFKKGQGGKQVLETFSSNAERFYNFKTIESLAPQLQAAAFGKIDAYYINERDIFGPDKRDLDWLHCFAVKI